MTRVKVDIPLGLMESEVDPGGLVDLCVLLKAAQVAVEAVNDAHSACSLHVLAEEEAGPAGTAIEQEINKRCEIFST